MVVISMVVVQKNVGQQSNSSDVFCAGSSARLLLGGSVQFGQFFIVFREPFFIVLL